MSRGTPVVVGLQGRADDAAPPAPGTPSSNPHGEEPKLRAFDPRRSSKRVIEIASRTIGTLEGVLGLEVIVVVCHGPSKRFSFCSLWSVGDADKAEAENRSNGSKRKTPKIDWLSKLTPSTFHRCECSPYEPASLLLGCLVAKGCMENVSQNSSVAHFFFSDGPTCPGPTLSPVQTYQPWALLLPTSLLST